MIRFCFGVRRLVDQRPPPPPTPPKGRSEGTEDRVLATVGGTSYWRTAYGREFRKKALGVIVFIGWIFLLGILAEEYFPTAVITLMITCGVFGGVVGFEWGRRRRDNRRAASAAPVASRRSRGRNR